MARHIIAVDTRPSGGLMIINSYDADRVTRDAARARARTLLGVWPLVRVYLDAEPDIWGSYAVTEPNVEIFEKGAGDNG
jgi:hypothetical protein